MSQGSLSVFCAIQIFSYLSGRFPSIFVFQLTTETGSGRHFVFVRVCGMCTCECDVALDGSCRSREDIGDKRWFYLAYIQSTQAVPVTSFPRVRNQPPIWLAANGMDVFVSNHMILLARGLTYDHIWIFASCDLKMNQKRPLPDDNTVKLLLFRTFLSPFDSTFELTKAYDSVTATNSLLFAWFKESFMMKIF